jgi:hypothetical protein
LLTCRPGLATLSTVGRPAAALAATGLTDRDVVARVG